jgi:hypothetical protein
MADFPSGPGLTVGQLFTSGWSTWMWDGVKWMASVPSGGVYEPVFGGTQYPMYGFLYNKTVGDPGYSAWAGFGAHRWRFGISPGDDFAAGSIDYRGYASDALNIVGAGTASGNRKINLFDNVNVTGNLTVVGTSVLDGITNTGAINSAGSLTIAGAISSTGSTAILTFQDRAGTTNWGWYAQGGIARLWNDQSGDRVTFDSGGSISTPGFIRTGSNILMGGATLYFSGVTAGGPYVYADSTNMTTQLGTGNGSFIWYNNPGGQAMSLSAGGKLIAAGQVSTGAGLRIGSVNVGGNTWAQLNALFGIGNTGGSAIGWNFSNGAGETDWFINRNGGGGGGLLIYDFPNVSGPLTQLLSLDGVGNLAVPGNINGGSLNISGATTLTGPLTINGMLTANAGINTTGLNAVGTTAQILWQDRANTSLSWLWYAVGGITRLYNGADRLSIDASGNLYAGSTVYAAGTGFAISGTQMYVYNADGTNLNIRVGPATGAVSFFSFYADGHVYIPGAVNAGGAITAGGNISGPNFLIGGNATTDAGTVGFLNANGPGIQFWGTATGGAGEIQFVVNGAAVGQLIPGGNLNLNGGVTTAGQFLKRGGGPSYRMSPNAGSTGIGSMWYTDPSTMYLLLTANNDAWGTWNGLRPFTVDLASGNVTLGHRVDVGGGLYANAGIAVTGGFTSNGGSTFNGNLTVTNSLYANQQIFMPLDNWLWQGGRAAILMSSDGNFYIGDGGAGWSTRLRGVGVAIDASSIRFNNNDNVRIVAASGNHARLWYEVGGLRVWSCGCINNGWWYVADESVGQMRFQIDTNGNATIQQSLTCGGNVQANGSTGVNGIWWGNNGGWWWTASPIHSDSDIQAGGSLWFGGCQLYNSGGWAYFVQPITCSDLVSRGNLNTTGNIGCSGSTLSFGGFRTGLGSGNGPIIYGDGNWIVAMPGTGNLGFMVYNSSASSMHQLRANGDAQHNGSIYCANVNCLNLILAQNNWVQGRDSANNPQNMLLLYTGDNNIYIGDSSRLIYIRSSAHIECTNEVRTSGSTGGFMFQNRDSGNANFDWQWYSSGSVARLWSSVDGDRVTIDRGGNINTGGTFTAWDVHATSGLFCNGLLFQNYTGWWWTGSPIHTDSEMTCSALNFGGCRIYNSGGYAYFDQTTHAAGHYSRGDIWCAGSMTSGNHLQANGGGWCIEAPNGGIYCPNEVHGGYVTSGGNVYAGNDITANSVFRGTGNGGARIGNWQGSGWDWMAFAIISGGYLGVSPDQGASGFNYTPNASWSDARLKLNIRASEIDALAVIGAIPVRAFDWTEKGRELMPRDVSSVSCGLVAQELEELIPDAVTLVPVIGDLAGDPMRCIIHEQLDAYYIRAFQQLTARIEELENLVLNPPERNLA